MEAPKQTLEEKLETAALAILSGLADLPAELSFHRAFDDDPIEEPAVLIAAQDNGVPPDEEAIEPTGNRMLMLGVSIKCHSDFGRAEHNELTGRVRDALMTSDVAARLTAEVAEFTAMYFRLIENVRSADGNSFTSIMTAEVWAAPADFE